LIFVVYGIARIGKSTVAKTVAEHSAERVLLEGRRQWEVGQVAIPRSRHCPALIEHINMALEQDPGLTERDRVKQFHSLIVKPLQQHLEEQSPSS
jgi:AAA+ ATPase superfamily predicted ATPase